MNQPVMPSPHSDPTLSERIFTFQGAKTGKWKVISMAAIIGPELPQAQSVNVLSGMVESNIDSGVESKSLWNLFGITSNERYVTREEKKDLVNKQEGLGRPSSSYAALIPIKKNEAWWALTQDERRKILEETSQHIRIGLKYLPAIARKLHHCRDLAVPQPFDFITWFEFAPDVTDGFNQLVAELRKTEEWNYVAREIDIRLKLS